MANAILNVGQTGGQINVSSAPAPGTPSAGIITMYAGQDKAMHILNEDGLDIPISSGGGIPANGQVDLGLGESSTYSYFEPSDYSDLVFWFDFADETSYTLQSTGLLSTLTNKANSQTRSCPTPSNADFAQGPDNYSYANLVQRGDKKIFRAGQSANQSFNSAFTGAFTVGSNIAASGLVHATYMFVGQLGFNNIGAYNYGVLPIGSGYPLIDAYNLCPSSQYSSPYAGPVLRMSRYEQYYAGLVDGYTLTSGTEGMHVWIYTWDGNINGPDPNTGQCTVYLDGVQVAQNYQIDFNYLFNDTGEYPVQNTINLGGFQFGGGGSEALLEFAWWDQILTPTDILNLSNSIKKKWAI